MNKRRRSLLQTELLLELDNRPAKTITDLAERVGAMRPSVSRSLRILREDKLLIRLNGKWQLTEAGKKEATTSKRMLLDTTEKVRGFADQVSNSLMKDMKQMLSINDFQLSMLNSPAVRMIDEITKSQIANIKISNIASDIANVIQGITFSPDALKLNLAIEPLIKTQELNAQLMRDILSTNRFTGLEEIIKSTNFQLAGAIADTITIRQSKFLESIKSSIDFDRLFTHLININESYEKIFGQYAEQIKSSVVPPSSFGIATNIALPTATVMSYNISVRNLFHAETDNFIDPLVKNHNDRLGDETLDIHLSKLDTNLVEMRRGAWLTLESNGPDYLRQAATSQRELLRQVLEILVPNSLLPNENKQGPQIKARVKTALGLGNLDAAFIDTCAKAVLTYYEELNKYTHDNEKHEESLRAIFYTGEGLIRFILTKANFYNQ